MLVVVVEGGEGGGEWGGGEGAGDCVKTVGVKAFLIALAEVVGDGDVGLEGEDCCVGV